MIRILILLGLIITLAGCDKPKNAVMQETSEDTSDLVIAFGSCSNQNIKNVAWEAILAHDPKLFIWGGDIVYADSDDPNRIRDAFKKTKEDPGYSDFEAKVDVTGTWDDHDYGLNDGGAEWFLKDSAQQILLDFLGVDVQDPRRKRKGVYHVKTLETEDREVKIIVLDTRYFRSPLTPDPTGEKRYVPNPYGRGTMLGEEQWQWLREQLSSSAADFHVIVSSIQFLSGEHGFESWSNMPHEVDRMITLLESEKPKGVIFLSGDRHIAEISGRSIDSLGYPLIDFTSSGMTHSYSSFSGEPNRYRMTKVISDKNFGVLKFNFTENRVRMEIRSVENELLAEHSQVY